MALDVPPTVASAIDFSTKSFSTGKSASSGAGEATADGGMLHQLTAIFSPAIAANGLAATASMTAFAANTTDMSLGLAATTDSSQLVNSYSSCVGICGKFDKAAKEMIQSLGA